MVEELASLINEMWCSAALYGKEYAEWTIDSDMFCEDIPTDYLRVASDGKAFFEKYRHLVG